ncbi:nitrile hydratase subunit beta [Pseudonocardia benzenivorans]|jgi:nitrile hydratase|uniref:nitrile hydratase n=2 Tax=Pseudonocardia TaxID=1847 RepID=F4CXY2_PSEUX|nr:nitrile hydratase subunit beta [Pseudonocardia dioxanivorans]AEA23867.1 Nitrile hydratase [Pseudonocardia dioxanivorans CB1190]GJF04471.1 nitrile hydratase [Pseudonocardia sp. D17]
MESVADIGGATGWGKVDPPTPQDKDAVFHEPWEGRAFALTLLTMGRVSGQNLDAFRYALGRLDPKSYFDDTYYGRWLNASELMLVESGILAPGAVDARARNNAGEDVEEPPVPEPNKPDYAPTAAGSLRQIDEAPRFAVGDTVTVASEVESDANKLPAYVRGHRGVVEAVQPAHVFPETHARFLGENAQHVYSVRFTSTELYGADAEPFELTIEIFDSYLQDKETAA